MARPAAHIQLSPEEESTLREWTRKGTSEQRTVERARIILLSHEGLSVEKVAERLQTRTARVSKWRQRFAAGRLNALGDASRPGKPRTYKRGYRASRVAIARPACTGWIRAVERAVIG